MYLYNNKAVFFGLLIQVITTIVFLILKKIGYIKLIRESENMGKIKEKKWNNIVENKDSVYNVDNYVDKYVNSYKYCGLRLSTISVICGYLLSCLCISWSIITIYGIYLEANRKDILWIIMLGILIVGGLFSLGYNVDNYRVENMIKVNMKDYIDNIAEINRKKEEVIQRRKEEYKNKIYNNNEKTVIDYASNNENVVKMQKKDECNNSEQLLEQKKEKLCTSEENKSYQEIIINDANDEERIIEGFLKQYFA